MMQPCFAQNSCNPRSTAWNVGFSTLTVDLAFGIRSRLLEDDTSPLGRDCSSQRPAGVLAGEKRPEPPAPADQGAIVVVVDAVVVVGAAVVVVVGGAVVVVVVAGSRAIQIWTVLPIFTSTPAAGS